MPRKITTKSRKTTGSKTTKSTSPKLAGKIKKATASSGQKRLGRVWVCHGDKVYARADAEKRPSRASVERSAVTGKFVSAKTGRIVKASPATPRLGKESIRPAVRSYVYLDTRTGKLSD